MIFSERYRQDGNLWMPADLNFQYSDGDEAENYILRVIRESADLSTGSPELFTKIKDWPSLYHLSAKRADLLRPLQQILSNKKILEIGSGCGAITRYLAELNCEVLALEGSRRRAQITSERCRDLFNVTVLADNFDNFETNEKFDCITLVGVLEYSNFFIKGPNPPMAMLQRIKQLLAENGFIIIAIENKLGLKYLAGAPEDHTGIAFTGVENKYEKDTAITFGKKELQNLLQSAGFEKATFLYPFPDYKLPNVVVTEKGFDTNDFDVPGLLLEKHEYIQDRLYNSLFNLSLAAREVFKNGFATDVANSFLVVAGGQELEAVDPSLLAVAYSTTRQKIFCKSVEFTAGSNEAVSVRKKRLYETTSHTSRIKLVMATELYTPGDLLQEKLVRITARRNWTLPQLADWAQQYYEILKGKAHLVDGRPHLSGAYLDLTPFNIIALANGEIFIFDQEWGSEEPLPLEYVLFRGIYYSLGQVVFFNMPAEGVPVKLLELSTLLMKQCLPDTPVLIEEYRQKEKSYFSGVWLQQYEPFDERPLLTRHYELGDIDAIVLKEKMGRLKEANLSHSMLSPLSTIDSQLFWSQENGDFKEADSTLLRIELTTAPGTHHLKLQQNIQHVKKLRLDISGQQGAFYLHEVSIGDSRGKVLFDWRAIKNNCITHNLVLVESGIIPGAFLFIATTDDPILEFVLTATGDKYVEDENLNVRITVSAADSDTIVKDLQRLTESELKNTSEPRKANERNEDPVKRISELERKILKWQTEREELLLKLNAGGELLKSQQKEMEAKNDLLAALQQKIKDLEQRSLINFLRGKFMNLKDTTRD